ncbi:glycosylphosphatidylinositol-specific phospholipase C [Trypanosoma theileri]|uniref:Glycosylphosphatidylinositol-specific phospholipase C n=1 Tax=Trypanosoma theileri TaxID=67003 RepID=A0A1X0NRH1_9TRYP|nr:glycosylphosphatidylinositol-specific phospholipase C [Trypanosoma theileri]ORC87287.1 glycosylphosphatidylinositol-specific phospholipase C [Trypanosoma theileri]
MLPYNESFISVKWHPQSWMYDMRSYIQNFAITQVFIIGSHNAGTYSIDGKSPFGRDAPGLLSRHAKYASLLRFFVRGTSVKWAKCQNTTILEQLSGGVRYLDLRIAPNSKEGGRLYITHGRLSVPLSVVIEQIGTFLRDPVSAQEFLILDFQHFFDMDSPDLQDRFVKEINVLSNHFIPVDIPLTTPLSVLWKTSDTHRVFLLLGKSKINYSFARIRADSLVSVWVNKKSLKSLLKALKMLMVKDLKQPCNYSVPPRLYVTQAVFTPRFSTVVGGIFSKEQDKSASGIRRAAAHVNSPLIEWFCGLNAHSNLDGEVVTVPQGMNTHGNILMLDHVDMGSCRVLGETRELNAVGMCIYLNMLRSSRLEVNSPLYSLQ